MEAHRIVIINFTEAEARTIAKAGYNVERGLIGAPDPASQFCPFYSPHPLYEYDVLFYNSKVDRDPKVQEGIPQIHNLLDERGSLATLLNFNAPPKVRVAFTGGNTGREDLSLGGIPFAQVFAAESNVSSFVESSGSGFTIAEVEKLVISLKNQIANVEQFVRAPKVPYPFNHTGVLFTRDWREVAGYGTTYESQTLPRYIILPQLRDFSRAILQILNCLESVWPELLPDRIQHNWINGEEFLTPAEQTIGQEIQQIMERAKGEIKQKQDELSAAAQQASFVRELLIALEDNRDSTKKLSAVVKQALTFLGFVVEDIDEKIKTAIKREDLWVKDAAFLAITEVTGTVNKNPKVKEFNDILGRMATIFKRQSQLPLPMGASISGLLILNYDTRTYPSKRPKPYTADDEHIIHAAIEQNIGILSTVELHRLTMAVLGGTLTKQQAREIIKQFGRIEAP